MSGASTRRTLQYALLALLFALLATCLLYPIWLTIRSGFAEDVADPGSFTLRHIALVFQDSSTLRGLGNALKLSIVTTVLSTLIALPLAMLSAFSVYPLKRLWDAAVLVPLILPPFVGALGLRAILGRSGALNALLDLDVDYLGGARFWGVAIALALHLYPIIYLNLSAALSNLDPSLHEAAAIGGAGPVRRFFRVTLPLVRPGLFAGGSVVAIWSFTELGTPLVFDYYEITSVQIFYGIKEMESSARPYALTFVMLTMAVLMYVVGRWAIGRQQDATSLRAVRARPRRPLGLWSAIGANGLFAVVTFLAIIPHLGVIFLSVAEPGSWYDTVLPSAWTLDNYDTALGHPLVLGSIMNSVGLSLAASFFDILLGLAIGYLIVRTTLRGRGVLDALSMLPLAVPGLVIAFGFIAVTLRWPFSSGAPLEGVLDVVGSNPNPMPLLVIAYGMRRLPYVVRATVAGLQQVGRELEEAAAVFGATPFRSLRVVVVPLIAANLLGGALLAFSFSMLEVSDSLILAQKEQHYPITKAIYTLTERLGDGPAVASAMGVWGMAFLATALIATSLLLGKKLGSVFRI